jgi:hypothetical protein
MRETEQVEVRELTLKFFCDVDYWTQMDGDERERLCRQCERQVVNLSAMTEVEAKRFLDTLHEQHVCLHAEVDDDGFAIFAAPKPPVRAARSVRNTIAATALTLPMLLAGCDVSSSSVREEHHHHIYSPDSYEQSYSRPTPKAADVADPDHPKHWRPHVTYERLPAHRRTFLLKIISQMPHRVAMRKFEEAQRKVSIGIPAGAL